jgi:protein gp37
MSKIEWTDITRNPIKGKCPVACPYCYARDIYDQNKWNPDIRFVPEVMDDLPRKPCRVFVGSTIELFLFPEWLPVIFDKCRQHPEHTFIFLTKKPHELPRWSPFPDNCEVGGTAPDEVNFLRVCVEMYKVEARVKFISFEPLLEGLHKGGEIFNHSGINGVIIGAMTGRKGKLLQLQEERYRDLSLERMDAVSRKYTLLPRMEWVKGIVQAADAAGIPVFLKDNLYKLLMERPAQDHDLYWEDMSHLRQELPNRSYSDRVVTTPEARVTSSVTRVVTTPEARLTSGEGGD